KWAVTMPKRPVTMSRNQRSVTMTEMTGHDAEIGGHVGPKYAGKARDVNARFAAMVSHYLFEVEFCNPASGWEKGQIEKNVRDA
ncbi:hypothetical protein ACG04R_28625, partial [Roseateles sp. BYS78W]